MRGKGTARLAAQQIDTPLGCMTLVAQHQRLVLAGFGGIRSRERTILRRRFGSFDLEEASLSAVESLSAYFAGDVGALARVEVDPGGTPFQRRVWRRLRGLQPGCVEGYGDFARSLGLPHGARAVGAANGANPVSVVIPCHRLVGANGQLTGYAYGIRRKRWLLRHEAAARDSAER